MTFTELAARRESCRNFADRTVPREKIEACVEAMRLSPSACNSQPYRFLIVTDDGLTRQLAKCLQQGGMNRFTDKAPAFAVVVEQKASLMAKLGAAAKDLDYTSIDIGIAAAHFTLAAADLGLGTCIIGWYEEKAIKTLLGIDAKQRVRLVIAMGYPATAELRPKQRKPVEELAAYF